MKEPIWLAEHTETLRPTFRIGRSGSELVAEWMGTVRLVVKRDGSNPRFFEEPGAYGPNIEKIRRGSARVLLRHLEGKFSLHGACVGDAGRAVVLLGRSGQGKSTIAAWLCERGLSLFADDAIALERSMDGYDVEPFETNHWLEPSAIEALGWRVPGDWKAPVECKRAGKSNARIIGIVELVYVDELRSPRLVRIERTLDAMTTIVPQVVRFVLDEPEVQRRELETLAWLFDTTPFYRLERPRGFAHLAAAASLLQDLVSTEGRTSHDQRTCDP